MPIKVILTGTTGMVGEGVLLECLQNDEVSEILSISRKPYGLQHPKLKELLIPDFMKIHEFQDQLQGYDACFFCAGVSSIGKNEEEYTQLTYSLTLHFAKVLANLNPEMVFNYVSGALTDSSEKGRSMWARVKGKTENDLMKLHFKGQYNFRPGMMKPFPGQKNFNPIVKALLAVMRVILPKQTLTMQEVGKAMIYTSTRGYEKQVLEVKDIMLLGKK
ncbi:NAD-dependent epimerase/dehydratase family protein [Algoriphagus mannitolivorans]|uniref:NAD-dependent epimerase/dehydratase family protein n=1 Tax=Algoriphagus mannitolivorans TaxID=226504 RepID=UPI00042390B2|nr:NAD-dependent epimerase/dehydratase family protein [Algoriphagus mannitolivorans]